MVGNSEDGRGGNARSNDGQDNESKTVVNGGDVRKGGSGKADGQDGLSIDAVSRSLRRAYETTLQEDIPDALMDLLRKLD